MSGTCNNKLSPPPVAELEALRTQPDEAIDYSSIPTSTLAEWRSGGRLQLGSFAGRSRSPPPVHRWGKLGHLVHLWSREIDRVVPGGAAKPLEIQTRPPIRGDTSPDC